MDGTTEVTGFTSTAVDVNNLRKTLPVACAANDHPLFVSEEDDDVLLDTQCNQLFDSSYSDIFSSELTYVNVEPELPTGEINELSKSCPSNSSLDSDSFGSKNSSSLEEKSSGSKGFSNGTTCHSEPPVTTNGLESSCEEYNSVTSTKPLFPSGPLDSKPVDKAECPLVLAPGIATGKANIPQDPAFSEPVTNKHVWREKGRASLQNFEVAKKAKAWSESSGNNLVFAYRKDADEVEIREIPSEDSRSSSDMEAEGLERSIEVQDDATVDLSSEDMSSVASSRLGHSATDFVASNRHAQAHSRNSAVGGEVKKSTAKKKQSAWGFVLNPNYKFRHDEFKRIFRNIPRSDRLIVDYSCALQRNILVQGRLYISQNWVCFYACIFGVETTLSIEFKDITQITKEKTARVFPNAIQIATKDEKHFISSLNARDKTYLILSQLWKSTNSEQPMSQEEMWSWIHYSYGEDLGISCDDQGYVPLSPEEKAKHFKKIEHEATLSQDHEGLGTSMDSKDLPIEEGEESKSSSGPPVAESLSRETSNSVSNSETADSDCEIKCCGHEHFSINVCNEVFNFPVDKLFKHCFSDSEVFRRFTVAKKTTDVVLSDWPETPAANGEMVRNLSYTLSLILAMTSKKAPATEKQTMHSVSKPGHMYIVDTECRTPTIPYGDSFYIVNRYCLTRVTESKSRLRLTSQLVYEKNVFFKSFIEKNATSGILETFKIFVDVLRKESSGQGDMEQAMAPPSASAVKADQPVSKANTVGSALMWEQITKNVGSIKFLSFWVLVMAFVMVVMLNRLWMRDIGDSSLGTCNTYSHDQEEVSDHEAIKQLQLQLQQQQIEIDKWKKELIHMIKTMEEFRQMMKDLRQRFN